MKKFICLALLALVAGCANNPDVKPNRKRNFSLQITTGNGWYSGSYTLQCDSFQMVNTKECWAYVDGVKMRVVADHCISPNTNTYLF